MSQRGVRDRNMVDSATLAALASMSAVDGPFSLDALLVDMEIDSLDLVELTQILEDECEVSLTAGVFSDVASVGDVIAVVRSCLR